MSRFDVVVIGGGPAGMMAAARAAQYGARVALVEKNKELGMKLMITGRGRCNFAHDEEDPELLAKDYRNGGEFILPALKKFGTKETAAFFLRRGVVAVPERGHRLYPRDGQDASTVVNAMWTALKDGGVQVLRSIEVRNLDLLGNKARRLITTKQEIEGSAFIIATGGLSFPNTGSTGDGYRFARKAGHDIVQTVPALCPVKVLEKVDDYLEGLKLKNVRVTLTKDGELADERFGEMDFTHFGLSGAIIMDMASSVDEALKSSSNVKIHIDLKPALDPERLDARIDRDFEEFKTDVLRFALRKMLPGQIIPQVLEKAGLDLGKPCGQTTPEERLSLRNTMKSFTLTPTGLLGFRHAIITRGGVNTSEVEPETMRSKLVPNLYFAGEVLDVDGPTGGYNLQACWSTGFVAGSSAAEALGFKAPTDEQIVRQMYEAQTRRDEADRARRLEERRRSEEAAAADVGSLGIAAELPDDALKAEEQKENPEDNMTIKTGPTDDKEFCGWRDPRRETGSSPAGAEFEKRSRRDRNEKAGERSRPDGRDGTRRRDYDRPRQDRDERRDGFGRSYDDRPYRPRDDNRPYRSREDRDGGYGRRYDDSRRGRDESPSGRDDGYRPYRGRDDRRGGFRSDYGDRPYRRSVEHDEGYRRFDDMPRRDREDGYRSRRDNDRPYRGHDDFRSAERSYGGRPYRSREEEDRVFRNREDRDSFRPRRSEENRPYEDTFSRRSRDERPFRRRDDRNDGDRAIRRRDDADKSYRNSRNSDGYRSKRAFADSQYRDSEEKRSGRPGGREGYRGKGSEKNGRKAAAAKGTPERAPEKEGAEESPRRRRFTNFEQFRRK